MKRNFLSLLILTISLSSFSQTIDMSVISSAGGFFETENESLTFVVGELVTETFSSNDLILTQGFLQPYAISVGIPKSNLNDISVNIYPNPTSNYFNIKISGDVTYSMDILDINGKLINTQKLDEQNTKVNISNYQSGTYFVRLFNISEHSVKTFVLIKEGY